jgi:spore coat polysaccharide biosynthesis protein SpsF (cytidylyltransferase family)
MRNPAKESQAVSESPERVVGVIQARMGSSRLPGKVLAQIGDRPLIEWTIAAMQAVPSITDLVIATTDDPSDDRLVAFLAGKVAVHRGPVFDVLTRCWDAVAPYRPTIVVRETADNPFVDPTVIERQIARLREGFDYVGCSGWPLGIAGEVATAEALGRAVREAQDPAEREHVMPFLYAHPGRFRVGTLTPPKGLAHNRYTVDTDADLEFARAIAVRLEHEPPAHLAEIDEIVRSTPYLASINATVAQKPWQQVDDRAAKGS